VFQADQFIIMNTIMNVLVFRIVWGAPYKEGKVAKDGRYSEMTEALIYQMRKIILLMTVVRYSK
jgi:hypothetical protein